MHQVAGRFDQRGDFPLAQHRRQLARLLRQRNVLQHIVPFQRFDEEEPEGGTVLHHGPGLQLPLSKQVSLKLPHMLGAELVRWLAEIRSQLVHHTDVRPHGTLRIISTLEFFQHHVS